MNSNKQCQTSERECVLNENALTKGHQVNADIGFHSNLPGRHFRILTKAFLTVQNDSIKCYKYMAFLSRYLLGEDVFHRTNFTIIVKFCQNNVVSKIAIFF